MTKYAERMSEQAVIDHAQRNGLRLDPALTARPHATLPEDTPEGSLLAEIRKLAKPYGWILYHTYDSRKSETGFPDLCLTDGVSLLMYELKDNHRKPSKDQETWLSLLAHTGKVECGVWRPRDFAQITARLTHTKETPHASLP